MSFVSQPLPVKTGFVGLGLLSAALAIFAAVLMTEPGQMMNLNRDWIIAYHEFRLPYAALVIGLYAAFAWTGIRYKIWQPVFLGLAGVGVLAALYVANELLDHFFPTMQRSAVYVSIEAADELLEDEEVVYAVEIGGEAVAYPRRFLMLPHVAGKTIGGTDVVMTYCALSNLPIVYDGKMGEAETDLGVLIQTNNNLLMYDSNSGEVIQQITGATEFGSPRMQTYANQMLSWRSFKEIYPQGQVFEYKFDRWLDGALLSVFDNGLQTQFDPDQGPMFPTLTLEDDRLGHKEQIWGLDIGGEQVAYTRRFVESNPVHNTVIGGKPVVLSFNAEYDTLGIFYKVSGDEILAVDVYGNSPLGRLSRATSYNGVFWMVWSHFFPGTQINK